MVSGKFNVMVVNEETKKVTMYAVTDSDPDSDGPSFAASTPAGKIELTVDNPEAFAQFKSGEPIYVLFQSKEEYSGEDAAEPETGRAASGSIETIATPGTFEGSASDEPKVDEGDGTQESEKTEDEEPEKEAGG